jgi:hypothetical protein
VDVADRIHAFLMLILIPKKGEPHWSRKLMPD